MSENQTKNLYCPECGGVFFAGSCLVYEHRDSQCWMRWNGKQWIPEEEVNNDDK